MEAAVPTSEAQALSALAAALGQAVDAGWETASDADLLAALRLIPTMRGQLDALSGRVAATAERFGAVQRAGSRNACIYVGANTSAAPAEVRADVRLRRWVGDYDKLAGAFDRGALSRRHVELLRRAESPATFAALRRDQAMLVEFAESMSFDDFGKALQYWVNAADPDGRIPQEQAAQADFQMRRHSDGSVTVKGNLDPLVGTAIYNAFMSEQQKLLTVEQERSAGGETRADGTCFVHAGSQRRVAAIANLIDRGSRRADGTIGTPLINIVMSNHVAEALLASVADPDVEIPIRFGNCDINAHGGAGHSIDGRCEFIDGTPIHPRLALAALGVANLRRVVLDARSRPVDVSTNAARFPAWMKQAILVASRGRCREPGCDAPVHWIHADHIHPRSRGGSTALANLDPLCGPANRAKSNTTAQPG